MISVPVWAVYFDQFTQLWWLNDLINVSFIILMASPVYVQQYALMNTA